MRVSEATLALGLLPSLLQFFNCQQAVEQLCLEHQNTRERKVSPLGTGAWVRASPPDIALHWSSPTYLHDLLILAALCHDFGTADAEIGFCDTNTL